MHSKKLFKLNYLSSTQYENLEKKSVKKMRKYLVGKEKGCNFALAFEKQRHGGAENEKVQAKALNFVKTTEKFGRFKKWR